VRVRCSHFRKVAPVCSGAHSKGLRNKLGKTVRRRRREEPGNAACNGPELVRPDRIGMMVRMFLV
jgi:hypothetical protein